jgi:acyl-CoA thioesterase I
LASRSVRRAESARWRIAVTAVAGLVAIASCHSAESRPFRPSGRIVVLGDSLAVSPSASEGFPKVLEDRLRAQGLAWSVVNAGVRGDTTAGGLRRIDGLLASNRPDILVLALGANDGLRRTDVGQMKNNLREIIARARAAGSDVLLCGMELPPLNVFTYGKQFRNAFAELAEEHDVAFVPFLLEDVAMDRNMNGQDGIHPNANGARRIAENLWPQVEPLLRAE